jgi:GT2 family glycosyltransferase
VLDIGGFDEGYRLYFEDVDLCRRIKDAEKKVMYLPSAVVTHAHQQTSRKKVSKAMLWHISSALRYMLKQKKDQSV